MSAEIPTPDAETLPARSRVVRSNRRQVLLFAVLTLILTVVTVWGGRTWLRNSETLIFAVGDANSLDARFAAKLAAVLKNSSARLRLKIVPNADSARALAQFDRRQADLAVLRTDAKVPPRARALAILEHDVLLLISPGGKKIKSLAELKKKKIAVLADSDNSAAFVRNILEISDNADGGLDSLEALQDELEAILRGAVIGLRDGTISSDGLDTFKLGYEFVRDEIGMRRDHLKRNAGHDGNVVIVKSAQSA